MKTGRKPKPTNLKLIQGNPGKRPINESEPQPTRLFKPRARAGMGRIAQAKWRAMCKVLSGMRVLTDADLDALEIYCREWALMHEALTDINARGRLLRTPTGGAMWNPSWAQYKHSQKVVRSIQSEFGMTPSARTSVQADAGARGKGNWDDF